MGALGVVDWIDRVDGASESPAEAAPVSFVRVPYAGRWYLTSRVLAWPVAPPPWWGDASWDPMISKLFAIESAQGLVHSPLGLFAMEETACVAFLEALSRILRGERQAGDGRIELPQFDPVGFRLGEESVGRRYDDGDAYDYALFRDGFALLGDVSKIRKITIRRWSPKGGFEG